MKTNEVQQTSVLVTARSYPARQFSGLFRQSILPVIAIAALAITGCSTATKTATARSATAAPVSDLPRVVDLKPFYTKVFVTDERTNSSYKGYFGRKVIDGLPFDVNGEVVLYGKNTMDRADAVSGIPIGCKFQELHLLHAVQWREYYGCPVAILRLHYTDGTTNDFQLLYDYQVNDWNRLLTEETEIVADPDTKIVWRGAGVYKGTGRLFKTVLRNPHPEKEVATMDLISTRTRAAYALAAATVANADPKRDVTPGMPLEPNRNFDGVVKIHVVDKETGAPIPNADVYPYMSIENEGVVCDAILTSTDGVVLVKYPIKQTGYVGVSITKDHYASRRSNWQEGEIPTEITYRLSTHQTAATEYTEDTTAVAPESQKGPSVTASVKTSDGKPAPGVTVFVVTGRDYLQLNGTDLQNQNRGRSSYKTDTGGHSQFPLPTSDFKLAAASPAGFAVVSKSDFTNNLTITLQPWARVEGTLLNHGHALTNREMYFFVGDGSERQNIWMKEPAATDAEGHFIFPYVPSGDIRLELKEPINERSWSYKEVQTLTVKPSETNTVEITMKGRPATGHWKKDPALTEDISRENGNLMLRPDLKGPKVPEGVDSPEKMQKWYKEWIKTDEGKKYMEAQRKGCQLQMKADGTVSAESVEPGKYILTGNFWHNGTTIAETDQQKITIPDTGSDEPFDLGEILIKGIKHLNIGDTAPDFSVKTLDDKPLKLSDFRGKYVLLDFWATWCGPCVAETPHMKAAYDAFGTNPQFVMISLSLDQNVSLPKKFAESHDIKWIQGFLGDWSKDTVTKDYNVRGIPSIFLISPDGKIIAQNLRGEAIKSAVGSALEK